MSLLKLPEIQASSVSKVQFDARPDALERWNPEVQAAASGSNTITIYDPIGKTWDGEGVTAKRVSAALHAIGDKEVVVNINSPGGDFFEGVAIFNLLRNHPHKVTVNVLGVAASAASLIAMSGDDIYMGEGSFLMIHNAWAVAIGNRHDMQGAADTLAPFDAAMAKVYAVRSSTTETEIAALMDRETWLGAEQAVKDGFATGVLEESSIDRVSSDSSQKKYLAIVEASMAKAGHTRSQRRDVLKNLFSSMPGATREPAMPSAGDNVTAVLQSLVATINGE